MKVQKREGQVDSLPVPPGVDTALLRYLTSVRLGRDDDSAPTLGRLFMRIRIVAFFVLALPIGLAAVATMGVVLAVLKPALGSGSSLDGNTIAAVILISLFVLITFAEAKLALTGLAFITRGYRARLVQRALIARNPAGATEPRMPAPSLADLDDRLAPDPKSREQWEDM